MTVFDDKTIDKEFVRDGSKASFHLVAPSGQEYYVSFEDKPSPSDVKILSVVIPQDKDLDDITLTMDFSNFWGKSNDGEFLDLNAEMCKFISPEEKKNFTDKENYLLDCKEDMYNIADRISDALMVGEEVAVDVISHFSLASKEVQAEAMYALVKMVVKYKTFSVYDDALRHSIGNVVAYTEKI